MTPTNVTLPKVVSRDFTEKPFGSMINELRSSYRFPRLARWGLQLAIVIIVPGGFVALALLWWLDRCAEPMGSGLMRGRTDKGDHR